MSKPVFPFGDGRAAERIAAIIVRWLEQRSLTRRLA
jgi:UDP-N-acetylglucosamine 2-epimerase